MILSLMNETLINPVNDTGIDVDALLFCKLLSYAYLSNAQTPLCIRHGITLASELEFHSWSPLTRQHNNLESHKSMAKKIMKMSGMQLIPTFYPVIAAQAILFKIVLSYPTADFHFMNFLMNLNLYGNGCIKVFRDSIFRLSGISDKFVFLDGFNAEEMVSSFVFAETFAFPLCPNEEEGMKIAKKVMLERWSAYDGVLFPHHQYHRKKQQQQQQQLWTCYSYYCSQCHRHAWDWKSIRGTDRNRDRWHSRCGGLGINPSDSSRTHRDPGVFQRLGGGFELGAVQSVIVMRVVVVAIAIAIAIAAGQ